MSGQKHESLRYARWHWQAVHLLRSAALLVVLRFNAFDMVVSHEDVALAPKLPFRATLLGGGGASGALAVRGEAATCPPSPAHGHTVDWMATPLTTSTSKAVLWPRGPCNLDVTVFGDSRWQWCPRLLPAAVRTGPARI